VIKLPLADVAETRIAKTVRLIEQAGGKAQAIKCDVTQEHEIRNAVDQTIKAFGRFKRVSRYRVVDA
jgi:NAD(P)-dependent dehydrogenase (short-subunit alcohol dehydrogenase family)